MKISRKLLKNTGKIIAILVLIPIIFLLAYLVVRISGKNKLYSDAKKNATALPITNYTPAAIEVELVDNDNSYNWQEGDIRYNGSIYRYNDEILTFLAMGIDKKGKVPTGETKDYIDGGQADALFLAVVNPKSSEINIVAINRNTITDVDVYNSDGSYDETLPLQITLQHGYGDGRELSCERQKEVVSKLFMNIPIHGYAAINMGAIPVINDAVGGVDVTVMDDTAYKSANLKKNIGDKITLHGNDAYEYVHHRDVKVFDSAGNRLDRQKQYLFSFIEKAKAKTKEDITFPITLYNAISDYLVTDISISEVGYLVSETLNYKFNKDEIYSMQGQTEKVGKFEEFYPDEQALYDMIIEIFYEKVN